MKKNKREHKFRIQISLNEEEIKKLEELKQKLGILNERELLKKGLAELYYQYISS